MIIAAAVLIWGAQLSLSQADDGKNLFIDKCGKCHRSGGEAPVFAPSKFASGQWERFFKREKHKRKKDISSQFSAEEIESIKKYLMLHAADSDKPEAVGLK
jgi:mono/diheme cytochrome c family protein